MLKTTEQYSLNEGIVGYVNYISIKVFKEVNEKKNAVSRIMKEGTIYLYWSYTVL